MKKTFTLFCMLSSILSIWIGATVEGNSWSTHWDVNFGSDPFSSAEVFILELGGSPADFDPPGANNFTSSGSIVSGWTANIINPDYLLIGGPPIALLSFDEYFSGDKTTQHFYADHLYYNAAGNFIWGSRWEWDGLHWDGMALPTGVIYDRTSGPVPEPSTMVLLGSGLIGLAGYARKKFFKK
jgi:hypothetical protein